jgi:peptide/nickel transport system ATP-binding protein
LSKVAPLLEVRDLRKYFPVKTGMFSRMRKQVRAVDGVSFSIGRAETLSLVGESGCGKSTVGRMLIRLIDPTEGQILLDGEPIHRLAPAAMRPLRKRLQVVFQDPFSSLNPRMRVRDIIAEPLRNFDLARSEVDMDRQVRQLLDTVRLPANSMTRFPHEFSGGQRQRIGIARALATSPDLIICDEPVSALDVSVKAQVINLLADLQAERGLSLLFISHDLAVVEHLTHRVAVMYLGRVVELADRRALFTQPAHPYTEILLAAVPVPAPRRNRAYVPIAGEVPSPIDPPAGCHFHTRCPYTEPRCKIETPVLTEHRPGQWVACHRYPIEGSESGARPASVRLV